MSNPITTWVGKINNIKTVIHHGNQKILDSIADSTDKNEFDIYMGEGQLTINRKPLPKRITRKEFFEWLNQYPEEERVILTDFYGYTTVTFSYEDF